MKKTKKPKQWHEHVTKVSRKVNYNNKSWYRISFDVRFNKDLDKSKLKNITVSEILKHE